HLAVFSNLKALDDDGTTRQLWDILVEADREALIDVDLLKGGLVDQLVSDEVLERWRRAKPEDFVVPGLTQADLDAAEHLMHRLRTETIPKDCAIDEYGHKVVGGLIKIGLAVAQGTYPEEHLRLAVKGYNLFKEAEVADEAAAQAVEEGNSAKK